MSTDKNKAGPIPDDDPAFPPTAKGSEGFAPLEAVSFALRMWWFLFALMIVGGCFGWLFHSLQPPVYEATAEFSASINYVATGPLTQYDEDVALNAVGDLLGSTPVLEQVTAQARSAGIKVTPADLVRMSSVERKFTIWTLRVRSVDPKTAEKIASLWIENGQALLLESYRHALQAENLNRYLISLETCLSHAGQSEPASVQCSHYHFAEIQADLLEAGKTLAQERIASRGLFSGLTIGPTTPVTISPKPVLYDRNQVVLAGCLIGFLLGIVLLQADLPVRWLKRS